MSLKNYIKNKKVQRFNIEGIDIYIKDSCTNGVSAQKVITSMFRIIPKHLVRGIKSINIGEFEYLKDRKIQGLYRDSSIYVTNKQDNESDLLDDIVHEIAHSVEELYSDLLYSDEVLEKEFLAKRKNMWMALKSMGENVDLSLYLDPSYNPEFDEFLHSTVGYSTLSMLTSSIFHSPYAATSLREYFADGFEAFFMREDIPKLKSLSPMLFRKITKIMEE